MYDRKTDPQELNNLANNPKYEKTAAEMKAWVKKNWPVRVEGGKAPESKKPSS